MAGYLQSISIMADYLQSISIMAGYLQSISISMLLADIALLSFIAYAFDFVTRIHRSFFMLLYDST